MEDCEDIVIHADFVTAEEEQAIVDVLQLYIKPRVSTRQVVRFGSFHPCSDGTIVPETEPIPPVLETIRQRLVEQGIMPTLPESVNLNIYPPRSTILPHIDNAKHCGAVITVVGLLENNDLLFRKTKGGVIDCSETKQSYICPFPARSLMILQGDKRYTWTHETQPIDRLRASLVFRNRLPGAITHHDKCKKC